MIRFSAVIKRFGSQGEKTGWTYIEVPQELAVQLQPNSRKSFRVKGKLDFPANHPMLEHSCPAPYEGQRLYYDPECCYAEGHQEISRSNRTGTNGPGQGNHSASA